MPTHEQIIEEVSRLVDEGLSVTLPVKGRSMLPFIVGGSDSVVLHKPGKLRPGDVVLAWVDGCRYVVHRIIRIEGEAVTLMGDGNLSATERCSIADIRAIATHTVDARGKVSSLHSMPRRVAARMWRGLHPARRYLLAVICRLYGY